MRISTLQPITAPYRQQDSADLRKPSWAKGDQSPWGPVVIDLTVPLIMQMTTNEVIEYEEDVLLRLLTTACGTHATS